MPDDEKKGSLFAQITTGVVVALLAGGTSPWWFNALSGKSKAEPQPVEHTAQPSPGPVQPLPVPTQTVTKEPELTPSREFFIGRWRVDQELNGTAGQTNIDYFSNGRYEGTQSMVNAFQGQRANITGTWTYERLSDKVFRLTFAPDMGYTTTGKFKILDHNHIQNIDQNYVAERVE